MATTKKPKPKAPKTPAKPRTQRIAAGKIAGKTVTEIAADEGISRQHASTLANSAEVMQIVASEVDRRRERVSRLFDQALDAVEACLGARKTVVLKAKDDNGYTETSCDLGPDHFATMTAVKRLIELTTAGRPMPKAPEQGEKRLLTLDEIRGILAAADKAA